MSTETSSTTRWIELPDAPAIEGLRARMFADPSDYERLATLIGLANVSDRIPWLPTGQNLEIEYEGQDGVDPRQDVILVEVGGTVIGAAGVERQLRDDVPTYVHFGVVAPDMRRRKLGTALLAWVTARATTRAELEDPGVTVHLQSGVDEVETGNRALLTGAGYQVVRHFFLMRRNLLDDIPDAPLPKGLEIRPVRSEQWRTIFDAENEAFRDHWGHREQTEGDYAATYGRAELDTDLWVVAWDGDQVAGVVQNWVWPIENERLGLNRGWLERISVRRPWRRRGLARAITAASLKRLRDLGLAEGMLGVDVGNPNNALGLYEGVGFEVDMRSESYRRVLEP